MPPFEAADEEHRARDSGGREDPRVVARAGGKLDDREPSRPDLIAQDPTQLRRHRSRLGELRRVEPDRRHELRERFRVGCTGIDGQAHARRDDVARSGFDGELAHGRHRTLDPARGVADTQHGLRRGDERVVAPLHRRRARVPGVSLEHELPVRVADDARDDAERRPRVREDRPLLDVELEERARE